MKHRATLPLLLLLCSSAFAQPAQPREERRGPPQEALDACKGKKEGAQVEAPSPRGDIIKGTCRMVMIPTRDGSDKAPPPPQR